MHARTFAAFSLALFYTLAVNSLEAEETSRNSGPRSAVPRIPVSRREPIRRSNGAKTRTFAGRCDSRERDTRLP